MSGEARSQPAGDPPRPVKGAVLGAALCIGICSGLPVTAMLHTKRKKDDSNCLPGGLQVFLNFSWYDAGVGEILADED